MAPNRSDDLARPAHCMRSRPVPLRHVTARAARLRNRLASTAPEDKAWTRDALDVRDRFTFDCAEWDISSEELIRTYSNAGDNSGGEQEKLMAFCLAGALSFNLASPESTDNRPVFAQLMLDEAFSKSDPRALSAFRKFGFQLDRGDGAERHPHPALHRQCDDGVQDRGHRAATPDRSRRWPPGRSRSSPRCARRCGPVPRRRCPPECEARRHGLRARATYTLSA